MPDYVHDGVPRLRVFIERLSLASFYSLPASLRYFAPLTLVAGEGDAAGEGLTAGLELVFGVVSVSPIGDADVAGAGLAVPGAVELFPGSVAQPAANDSEEIVRSRSAVRLIIPIFGVVMGFFPRSSKIEKQDDSCPFANWWQRAFPQRFCVNGPVALHRSPQS